MKERLKAFGYCSLFWLLFFIVTKVIFLGNHFWKFLYLPVDDWFGLFLHGLPLDLYMMAWIMLPVGLVLTASAFIKNNRWVDYSLLTYSLLLVILFGFIVIVDVEWYRRWGTHLDSFAIEQFGLLGLAIEEVALYKLLQLIATWLVLCVVFYFLYQEIVGRHLKKLPDTPWITRLAIGVLTLALLAPILWNLGFRSDKTPTSYFSEEPFANHAATNMYWHTFDAILTDELAYGEGPAPSEKETITVEKMFGERGNSKKLLREERPNIILLVLRDYSAKLLSPLLGLDSISPNLNGLVKEGVLFDHMYANGIAWDKGLSAIFNGYPSFPHSHNSLVKSADKAATLPFLGQVMKAQGYTTGIAYGFKAQELDFEAYLNMAGFDRIIKKNDFKNVPASSSSVHDHYVLDRILEEGDASTAPFFYTFIGANNIDIEEISDRKGPRLSDIEKKVDRLFLNTAYHKDETLGDFIKKAKEKQWWDNTLLVILSDQGSSLPGNTAHHEPDRFKIPMLWLGGALRKKDTIVHTYGMQSDVSKTLLRQMGIESNEFRFSNDLLSENPHSFAIYAFGKGYGFVQEGTKIIYDDFGKYHIAKEGAVTAEQETIGVDLMRYFANNFHAR